MLDHLAYWWRVRLKPRLIFLACGAAIVLVVPWLIYDQTQEGPRWERYKIEHHCFLQYRPGELGPEDAPSGLEAWKCDGRMIWKNPVRAGVGGQI